MVVRKQLESYLVCAQILVQPSNGSVALDKSSHCHVPQFPHL